MSDLFPGLDGEQEEAAPFGGGDSGLFPALSGKKKANSSVPLPVPGTVPQYGGEPYIAQKPPTTLDQNPAVAQMIRRMDESGYIDKIANRTFKTVADVLQTVEFAATVGDTWYGTMEATAEHSPIAALQLAIAADNTTDAMAALHQATGQQGMDIPVAGAALDKQNMSTYVHENERRFIASELDWQLGIFNAVPTQNVDESPSNFERFKALFSEEGTERTGQIGPQEIEHRDFREELAAEATEYLRHRDIGSDAEKNRYQIWLYTRAQEKIAESEGRKTLIGRVGVFTDLPRVAMTGGVNNIINQIHAPNDQLNRGALSLGQNFADWAGLHAGDDPGSSFLNQGWAKVVLGAIKYAPTIALPGAAAVSAFRGEGLLVETPYVAPLIEELQAGNSYDIVSGGADFLTYLGLDPINYAAGIGFGAKAATIIPRGMPKAQAVMKSLVPFYGVHATGVRYGVTSRVTYSLLSKTPDEMVAAGRLSSNGRRMASLFRSSNSAEELMRKVPSLRNKEVVRDLIRAAKLDDDFEMFWGTIRWQLNGAHSSGSSSVVEAVTGLLNKSNKHLHNAAQDALDAGQLGVRDVQNATFGASDVVYEAVRRVPEGIPESNPGVIDRLTRRGPRMRSSPIVNTFVDKAGDTVDIRQSGNTYGAFVGDEWVGGLELGTPRAGVPVDPDWGVLPQFQGRGIGTKLIDIAPGGRAAVEASPSLTQQARRALGFEDPATGVLRVSPIEGDGARKAIVTTRRGWSELDVSDPNFTSFLSEAGHQDLAAKLQFAEAQLTVTGSVLSQLDPEEIAVLQRFADNLLDDDAIRIGDEILVGKTSGSKLLWGDDLAEATDVTRVLPDEILKDSAAYSMSQLVNGRYKEIDLIDRMPTISNAAVFGERASRWVGFQGSNRVSEFARRTRAGIANTAPVTVSITKPSTGGADLRRFMKLLGVKLDVIDSAMDEWWSAGSSQARRSVVSRAIRASGEDIQHPVLTYELFEWDKKHGVVEFLKDKLGASLGSAKATDGTIYNGPIGRAWMTDEIPLPDVAVMVRELARYRRAKRLPKSLVYGLKPREVLGKTVTTGTRGRREALVRAYRGRIKDKLGVKALEDFGPDIATQNENLMAVAYADVLGYGADRTAGMGLVTRMARVPGSAYSAFHSTFTIAQLAFRPFAWASRVNMEEHIRAMMVGLPTLMRNPVQYGLNFWDAFYLTKAPKRVLRLQEAAQRSADDIFRAGEDGATVLARADELMPGWAKKVRQAGLAEDDLYSLRVRWSHDLSNTLLGKKGYLNLSGRGNMTRRTMFRSERFKNVAERVDSRYGIDLKEWDWFNDVPQIVNKSNVWMISDEMQSSIKEVDWVPNMRPRDIPIHAASYQKKVQQAVNDEAGGFVLRRMVEQMNNEPLRHSSEHFLRKHGAYWKDQRDIIKDIARFNGRDVSKMSELDLVTYFLDDIWRDQAFGTLLGPMWGGDLNEKIRIVQQAAGRQKITATANGVEHTLDLRSASYADGKPAWGAYMQDNYLAGNFEFPTVAGVFHPLYANTNTKNPFKKFTNFVLQTFGENVSQTLHRRPAYLFERQRVRGIYERIGWSSERANDIAHQKAFETVNYVFFNNQHTGMLLHRMNKVVPFFSAWAEVLSTWAWKIPSQNFLPLGYARMIHRMEVGLQGLVKMGLVEQSEDGEWHLNLEEAPTQTSPLGRGLSRAGRQMMQTPITVIQHMANIGGALAEATPFLDDFNEFDFGSWKKDNYQIAVGSPVRINTHGVMGVNQFAFGPNPALQAAGFAAAELPGIKHVLQRLPFGGDTELIEGDTLQDMYENLPSDVAVAEFLSVNELALKDRMGEPQYNLLFDEGGRQFANPADVDTAGMALQVPKSSWFDNMVDDLVFPFGRVETVAGALRQLTPSYLGYIYRSLGLMTNDDAGIPGWLNIVMSPFEEYQISGEINKSLIHLEVTEGFGSRASKLSDEIYQMVQLGGFEGLEDLRKAMDPESEEAHELARLENELETVNAEWMKRATDNAAYSMMGKGLMGLFAPASPRMFFEEQKTTAQYWATKEMADAARVRGSLNWADGIRDIEIEDVEDLNRVLGLVGTWLQDETGGETKAWFSQQYPSLLAWTQPTTFWGPAGAPPEVRDMDSMFDDIDEGKRQPLPYDVLMQRVARSDLAGTKGALIIAMSGTNDPVEQGVWALENWGEYQQINEEFRKKYAALDWWDTELNDGAYDKWRTRHSEDLPTLMDSVYEQIYVMEDAADEILALGDLQDFSPEDVETVKRFHDVTLLNYRTVMNEFLDEVKGTPEFRNPREEIIATYFADYVAPYYEGLNRRFDRLAIEETREGRSAVFEDAREYRNMALRVTPSIEYEGEQIRVPNELERVWDMKSDEERRMDLQKWTGRKVEWLDDFQLEQLAAAYPAAAEYLPLSPKAKDLFSDATALKNDIIADARENPALISRYDRNQQLDGVDEWLEQQLALNNFQSQIVWKNAWPIERLMLSRQLPSSLAEIGEWYLGIKQILDSAEKGPQSELGRNYFLSLTDTLEREYFLQNDVARQALDKLGLEMFNEEGRYAVYARLYGQFTGELD